MRWVGLQRPDEAMCRTLEASHWLALRRGIVSGFAGELLFQVPLQAQQVVGYRHSLRSQPRDHLAEAHVDLVPVAAIALRLVHQHLNADPELLLFHGLLACKSVASGQSL